MSIILGALGGLGEAMQQIGAKNQAAQLQLDNDTANNQQRSDLEIQRQETLAQFKNTMDVNTANAQRAAQADRIQTAAGNIADSQIAKQAAIINGSVANNIVDPANWTPEQQAAVDQASQLNANNQDRDQIISSPETIKQAGVQTGDLTVQQALANDNKQGLLRGNFANTDNLRPKLYQRFGIDDGTGSAAPSSNSMTKPSGASSSPARVGKSPYPEGTVLSGPGGKRYVVRNGTPVPQ